MITTTAYHARGVSSNDVERSHWFGDNAPGANDSPLANAAHLRQNDYARSDPGITSDREGTSNDIVGLDLEPTAWEFMRVGHEDRLFGYPYVVSDGHTAWAIHDHIMSYLNMVPDLDITRQAVVALEDHLMTVRAPSPSVEQPSVYPDTDADEPRSAEPEWGQ